MIPKETERESDSGEPMAITNSPSSSGAELPNVAKTALPSGQTSFGSTLRIARSV